MLMAKTFQQRIEDTYRMIAEVRRILDLARELIEQSRESLANPSRDMKPFRWRSDLSEVNVKAILGIVVISGISSPERALQICEHFLSWGVKATIGMDAVAPAYQVSVDRLSVEQVNVILGRLGIEAD